MTLKSCVAMMLCGKLSPALEVISKPSTSSPRNERTERDVPSAAQIATRQSATNNAIVFLSFILFCLVWEKERKKEQKTIS